MLDKVKRLIAVVVAIVLGIKELAAAVETDGHGDAKKAFVMGAFEVLMTLDDALFSGFVSERLTAAADKVIELWVQFDKIVGVFKPKPPVEETVKNS